MSSRSLNRWWRRRLRSLPWVRGLVAPEDPAEIIEEGVAIAMAAAQLTLRNRIIVESLARGGEFSADALAPVARTVLLELAEEQDAAAEFALRLRRQAWSNVHSPLSTHDYGDRDLSNLRRRHDHSRGVAAALRGLAADEGELLALVARSRDAAWADVAGNLVRRLREGHPEREPDYEAQRGSRIEALLSEDLGRLMREADRRREPETP